MENILDCTPLKWVENEADLLNQLKDTTVWNRIPLLNVNELHNLKDSSLVRFRGMIQDMHGPEYYLEKFEVISDKTDKSHRNGKYCDAAITNTNENINFDCESNVTSERHTYVVVSVPGINDWVNAIEETQFKIQQTKPFGQDKKSKRAFDETMDTETNKDVAGPSIVGEVNQKKSCRENSETPVYQSKLTQPSLSKEYLLNFPLPCHNGKTCHLKIYKNNAELKLNDMCEFVGFLSMDPIIEAAYQETEEVESKMENEVLHPPSSLVPRIHCVSFKKLQHNNPLLISDSDNVHTNRFSNLRKELLIVLTQLLLGDELAAEYLIYHLLSEVYLRKNFLPLGKFCLNISNVPKFENIDYVGELYKFIEMLLPKSYYLPMTLENMNDLCFVPKKDYECNRLTSGILQLSHSTHVVVNETKLKDGKLNSSGVNSVRALSEAIRDQKINYDFNYYQLEYDCDIPFLILSEGASLLGSDVHVVLKPEQICIDTFSEIIEAAKMFLKPELANDIRKYLTLARLIKYEISENVEKLVHQQFLDMRQEGNVSVDDIHNLLVLARLVTIGEGESQMDDNYWKKACDLERQRKARIVK